MIVMPFSVPPPLSVRLESGLGECRQRHGNWLQQEENLRPLAWLVAFAGCFLLTGLAGILREDDWRMDFTPGSASAPAGLDAGIVETTLAELQSTVAAETLEPDSTEVQFESPPVVEMPLELQDLPELIPALVTEDVCTVPAAPKIESVLTPVEPPKPRPVVNRAPSPATRPPSQTSARPASPGGGMGGTGISGSGGSGRFPTPPYPSFARSRGIQGSVMLTIIVNATGAVENAIVSGSTGYSELDSYAASWVRRNWRFPPGAARSFKLPVVFKLR
ncbi:MAG TPA: hypothetical protein DIT13_10645 [Verrucomicrobiales bacterium]|nr:hypothetical protein [Verrucomicrobiales bacterium]HRJ07141.1 TonB family protein [Prosthecobacter sp.]HRK13350.1 TonB family protein [Prosthecobacter sp.]